MEHGHDRGTRALPAVFVLFLFSFRWRSCRAGRSAMTRAVNLDGHRVSTPDVYLLRWRMRRRRSFKRFMRFLCHFGRMPLGRLTVPISCVEWKMWQSWVTRNGKEEYTYVEASKSNNGDTHTFIATCKGRGEGREQKSETNEKKKGVLVIGAGEAETSEDDGAQHYT